MGSLKDSFRKATAGLMAGAVLATSAGNALASDEYATDQAAVPAQEQAQTYQAPEAPWSKDSQYLRQTENAKKIFESKMTKLDAKHSADAIECNTKAVSGGAKNVNRGQRDNPLAKIGAITGAVTTASTYAQCKATVDSAYEQGRAQLESSFAKDMENLDKVYARKYESAEKAAKREAKAAEQDKKDGAKDSRKAASAVDKHQAAKAKACEQAEIKAIKSGKPMNPVQQKMCTDILKR